MTERSHEGTLLEPQACRSEPPDVHRLRFMARAIGRRGYLHRFVPSQPRWCRMVGDEIERAFDTKQQLHPFEFARLTYVFNKARARHKAQLMRMEPKCEAVHLNSVVDEHGIKHWHGEPVPLLAALLSKTEGSA